MHLLRRTMLAHLGSLALAVVALSGAPSAPGAKHFCEQTPVYDAIEKHKAP